MLQKHFPLSRRGKKIELSVPMPMVKYFTMQRKFAEFRVWLFFKKHTIGRFEDTKESRQFILKHIGYKKWETVQKHMDWLVANGLMGHDSVEGVYFVRGYQSLCERKGIEITRTHARLHDSSLHSKSEFRLWCYTALMERKMRCIQRAKRMEPHKRGSLRKLNEEDHHLMEYQGLSVRRIAKLLNVSIATVVGIKERSIHNDLLRRYHRYSGETFNDLNVKYLPHLRSYILHSDEQDEYFRIKRVGNKIVEVLYDEIHTNITFTHYPKK